MADINDRLQRLSRRDELARRARQRAVPATVAGAGDDFLEVVEAVAQVVRRHPGMSIMLAPADGRPGGAVIRVSERHGDAEVAPVPAGAAPGSPSGHHPQPLPGDGREMFGDHAEATLGHHRGLPPDLPVPRHAGPPPQPALSSSASPPGGWSVAPAPAASPAHAPDPGSSDAAGVGSDAGVNGLPEWSDTAGPSSPSDPAPRQPDPWRPPEQPRDAEGDGEQSERRGGVGGSPPQR